jgi:hypothetical protein
VPLEACETSVVTRKRPGFVEEERSWGSWGLLLAGIGFAAGAVLNLGTGAFANAAVGAPIGAFGIGSFVRVRRARKARDAFRRWLYDEAEAVRNGGATWGGILITPATIVRTYDTALSVVFLSTYCPSVYVVDGTLAAKRAKYLALAGTLLFGWWAIPAGPLFVLIALIGNVRGGNVDRVGELLDGMGR